MFSFSWCIINIHRYLLTWFNHLVGLPHQTLLQEFCWLLGVYFGAKGPGNRSLCRLYCFPMPPALLTMVAKFGELGGKEGCGNC